MSKITQTAKGRPCLVRLPCCNANPETTVAAHFRSIALGAGMGIKPNDVFSAHACSACHDVVDGRRNLPGYTKIDIRLAHAVGVLRTIDFLVKEGILKVNSRTEIA